MKLAVKVEYDIDKPKKHNRYNSIWIFYNVTLLKTGIWSKSALHNPSGSFSTQRSFTGAVLPTEASK